jgi:MerR family transcriptional regulator, copper efflux regulator
MARRDVMKRALGALVAQCRGEGSPSDCPILDALGEDGP